MENFNHPFQWNKVTPLSKYLAMFLFVTLPFIGFVLGIKYQERLTMGTPVVPEIRNIEINTPITDSTTNWKTYTNAEYGISFKYPPSWYPQDITSSDPAKSLASISFFAMGSTPSIGAEGNEGNELLKLYILNPMSGDRPMTRTKDQFISSMIAIGYDNISTISGLPAASRRGDLSTYSVWYNNAIELSIYSSLKEGQVNIGKIISTMDIVPNR